MKRALLLNATYEPLHFISDIDAIVLYYKGRAEVVTCDNGPSVWDESFASPSTIIQIPATLRLLKRINRKWKPPRFRKKILFNRDSWMCQYCKKKLKWETVTIDHVLPSSRGGKTSWLNCVTACKQCNKKKANRTPDEAGIRLIKRPSMPSSLNYWDAGRSDAWHPDWVYWLPQSVDISK